MELGLSPFGARCTVHVSPCPCLSYYPWYPLFSFIFLPTFPFGSRICLGGREGGVGIGCFSLGCLSLELAVISQRGLCRRGSFELYFLNGVKGGRQEE